MAAMRDFAHLATATLGVGLRRALGAAHPRAQRRPSSGTSPIDAPTLVLYEYEASPYCKRVREAVCALGLAVRVRPCPRTTLLAEGVVSAHSRFRAEAAAQLAPGAPLRFPLLLDGGVPIAGSREIVAHLWRTRGDSGAGAEAASEWAARTAARSARWAAAVPTLARSRVGRNALNLLADEDLPGLFVASVVRPLATAGLGITPARDTAASSGDGGEVRQLWAREGCARARLLREALCTLQLPYTLVGMGGDGGDGDGDCGPVGAARADALRAAHGSQASAPFLVDGAQGVAASGAGDGWVGLVRGLFEAHAANGGRSRATLSALLLPSGTAGR